MENADIVFICPKCHQWLEAPPDLAGLFVECPKCDEIVKVPIESQDPDVVEASAEFSAPVPPPPESDNLKGTTVRIELPQDLNIPPPAHKKKFILRRPT